MCNSRNNFESIVPDRGLHSVWVKTHDCGTTRLVLVWTRPAMRTFATNTTTKGSHSPKARSRPLATSRQHVEG